MYADGDGVKQNKARAFEYFRRLTMRRSTTARAPRRRASSPTPSWRSGNTISKAFPGRSRADAHVAHDMFRYAASYFADPEAQYHLGRLYLAGKGAPKDPIQAARWLRLAANKGEHRAQALLGDMLFKGEDVPRQAALGLFWLIVAKDSAGPDEGWITETYRSALAQATDSERRDGSQVPGRLAERAAGSERLWLCVPHSREILSGARSSNGLRRGQA